MNYTYGTPKVYNWGSDSELKIGNFCSIAFDVKVFLDGDHRTDWVTTYPFGHIHQSTFPHHGKGHPKSKGDVVIKNDVWIGAGASIISGVTVGNGAVIAAYSVVTKDVPDYCIVAGNPAKVVKKRFKQDQIDALLENPWWELPEARIRELVPLLCSGNIDELIAELRKR